MHSIQVNNLKFPTGFSLLSSSISISQQRQLNNINNNYNIHCRPS
jgi:hypothetical protein